MTVILKIYKTGFLFFAGTLFVLATLAQPVTAQSYSSTDNRIKQLENQVQTLSRSVYRGAPPPAGGGTTAVSSAGTSAIAVYETRISQLERQQRSLIGQIEELNHSVAQMRAQVDKMHRDVEARLQKLEGGHTGAATSRSWNYDSPNAPETITLTKPPGRMLGTIPSSGKDDAQAAYDAAFTDIRNAQYRDAEEKFRIFLKEHPSHTLAPNAQYWLSETFYVRGEYKESAKLFAQGYQKFPKSSKAPDSLLKLGLSLAKLGKTEDACLSLHQLQKEFPSESTPATRRAKQEMKQLSCL